MKNQSNSREFRDVRASHLAAERITPEGFDAYVQIGFRKKTYVEAIPESGIRALRNYVFDGTPPGDFLQAVLGNDLMSAVSHADSKNISAIPWYCGIIYNYLPSQLHGSRENVEAWVEINRRARVEEREENEENERQGLCGCGSGLPRESLNDARGIFCAHVCDRCRDEVMSRYRPEIFTDPNYDCDEDVEPD